MTDQDSDAQAPRSPVDEALDAGRELGAAAVFFHGRVAEVLGLGPTDTKTLDILRSRGDLTPKELGEITGISPAGITGIVDRLEQRGLVTRRAHPTDGRRVLIAMDPTAQQRLAPLYTTLSDNLTDLFESMTPEALNVVIETFQAAAGIQMAAAHNLHPNDDS